MTFVSLVSVVMEVTVVLVVWVVTSVTWSPDSAELRMDVTDEVVVVVVVLLWHTFSISCAHKKEHFEELIMGISRKILKNEVS